MFRNITHIKKYQNRIEIKLKKISVCLLEFRNGPRSKAEPGQSEKPVLKAELLGNIHQTILTRFIPSFGEIAIL